ncbi:ATP-binding cassette domain-containing protein [Methylobacterium sp. C25]|uniref:ATP-binding cassette domain-containing protein n=1 Tax=Methylobacterium sp. C25 TaxID=2721622 RepID=UPI001F45F557|nr:ATP-binding cassette domain-containing protein [Methylobacterium sp. C25]MCE4222462.1 ATP-binding cassette domain-containing protein [Methylobacterium sp. C25]
MSAPLFQFDNLTFAVEGRTLLQPVSATLERGRVYGLIGHNGSGKSTLLKLLARQQDPSGGTIHFEDKPLNSWNRREFARKVAYLPQQPPAATGLTVRELVGLGRYPWHGALGRFGEADRAKVEEAMRLTEVEPFADRLVDSLSGGERQRVWLAMLVAQDASCMLLDEPTSALDIGHQLQVLRLVRRLAERGPSVVVVLHDVNMAARFCDELIALHTGRLIRRGPCAELMTEEALRAIYDVPMAVLRHPENGQPVSVAL